MQYISPLSDDGENSWRIRYGAMKGLVRVCRHYSNDVTKDGVTNTAWSLLTQRQSTESESRVLEAIKIAKVEHLGVRTNYQMIRIHQICRLERCA
jgi:hypothetical protein